MTEDGRPGSARRGPLADVRVVEFVGLGPAPFGAMVLADLGADVLRIARPGATVDAADVTARNRPALTLDLRRDADRDEALALVDRADVLIEGFRPGVMERLGLGPDACRGRRPALIYARMTGWGQHGPLAHAAGHDIDYIAISGALHAIGRAGEAPVVPLNYIGDFGGGGMLLAVGVLAALHERERSGEGQVVDVAMTDGAALLSSFMYAWKAQGRWSNRRGDNLLDGAAPFYGTYLCADGLPIALGPLEPAFYREFRARCGLLDEPALDRPDDPATWPAARARLEALFASAPRAAWCERLEGSDACFAPVLDWDEAPRHPHNRARDTFVEVAGVVQPAPAPRFSRTPAARPEPPSTIDREAAHRRWREPPPGAAAPSNVTPIAPPIAPSTTPPSTPPGARRP